MGEEEKQSALDELIKAHPRSMGDAELYALCEYMDFVTSVSETPPPSPFEGMGVPETAEQRKAAWRDNLLARLAADDTPRLSFWESKSFISHCLIKVGLPTKWWGVLEKASQQAKPPIKSKALELLNEDLTAGEEEKRLREFSRKLLAPQYRKLDPDLLSILPELSEQECAVWKQKMSGYFIGYIEAFIEGRIVDKYQNRLPFQSQMEWVIRRIIADEYLKYGHAFTLVIQNYGERRGVDYAPGFLFLHTIWALMHTGRIVKETSWEYVPRASTARLDDGGQSAEGTYKARITLLPKFINEIKDYAQKAKSDWQGDATAPTPTQQSAPKENKYLRSISLVTPSLEPSTVIFMVLDGHFNVPVRFSALNSKGGPTSIKKLYDIAYLVNAPGKMVPYDRKLANGINNGLFKNRPVAKFMRTNKFPKPTLVQKSEDKLTLVLKNDVQVQTLLIKNIPTQYQYLYTDKTE